MGLTLVTGPALEPLTVAEVRAHLRMGYDKVLAPPSAAPTVALAGVAGNVTAGEHRYRVTFVNADGESDAGEISAAVTTSASDGQVSISDIPTGDDTVTARRLYRTKVGGSVFYRLTTLADNTTTTYTDNTADGSLGDDVTVDTTLAGLIAAARQWVEKDIGRPLITQTWRRTMDAFPSGDDGDLIDLMPNVLSITSLQYVDGDGATQTWSAANYSLDASRLVCRLVRGYGLTWPSARAQRNAVTVTMAAGYGATAASVPESIRQAMKLLIGIWHAETVGDRKIDHSATERAIGALLGPYRALEVA